MRFQAICGLIIVLAALACGTLLLYKQMDIKDKEDQERRRANEKSVNKIRHDKFRLAYEAEYERRELAETKLNITAEQLKRAREQMASMKIQSPMVYKSMAKEEKKENEHKA